MWVRSRSLLAVVAFSTLEQAIAGAESTLLAFDDAGANPVFCQLRVAAGAERAVIRLNDLPATRRHGGEHVQAQFTTRVFAIRSCSVVFSFMKNAGT